MNNTFSITQQYRKKMWYNNRFFTALNIYGVKAAAIFELVITILAVGELVLSLIRAYEAIASLVMSSGPNYAKFYSIQSAGNSQGRYVLRRDSRGQYSIAPSPDDRRGRSAYRRARAQSRRTGRKVSSGTTPPVFEARASCRFHRR